MKTVKVIISKGQTFNFISIPYFIIKDIKQDKIIVHDKGSYSVGVFSRDEIEDILSESQLKEFEIGANTFEVSSEILEKINPEYAPEKKQAWSGVPWFIRWLLYVGFFLMLLLFGLGTAGGSTSPSNKRYRKVIKHGFWGKTTYYVER